MRNTKIRQWFAAIVLLVLFLFCIVNLESFFEVLYVVAVERGGTVHELTARVENLYRENLYEGQTLVDGFGIYQKAIGNRIIGPFQHAQDDNGCLHEMDRFEDYEIDNFVEQAKGVQRLCRERNLPLLYVQPPCVEDGSTSPAIEGLVAAGAVQTAVAEEMEKLGIPVLNLKESVGELNAVRGPENLYFRTDLHMQTESELWMAAKIADRMESEFGLQLAHPEYLTDMSLYTVEERPFLGGDGRTNGRYYTKLDTFRMYMPKFETLLTEDKFDGEEPNTDEFACTVMNGLTEESTDSPYIYWVLNYMEYSVPMVRYVNELETDGLDLLVMFDSLSFRTFSYLTLTAHSITVLDPRFFDGEAYIQQALEEQDYDLAILCQGNFLLDEDFCVN